MSPHIQISISYYYTDDDKIYFKNLISSTQIRSILALNTLLIPND
jgi:hypothetical protein